jgi:hypothetical protein
VAQPDFSPSAERNKQPILEVLRQFLPAEGTALEIASGTGQHVEWFGQGLPGWSWLPTEAHPGALYSMEARLAQTALPNVLDSVALDVLAPHWFDPNQAVPQFDLIFCANMLHIAPRQASVALMQGSARHLTQQGVLVTYGPYFEPAVPPSHGNLEFDQSLRAHNSGWGIHQLPELEQEAHHAGLSLRNHYAMPANNLLLVWGKPPTA